MMSGVLQGWRGLMPEPPGQEERGGADSLRERRAP